MKLFPLMSFFPLPTSSLAALKLSLVLIYFFLYVMNFHFICAQRFIKIFRNSLLKYLEHWHHQTESNVGRVLKVTLGTIPHKNKKPHKLINSIRLSPSLHCHNRIKYFWNIFFQEPCRIPSSRNYPCYREEKNSINYNLLW